MPHGDQAGKVGIPASIESKPKTTIKITLIPLSALMITLSSCQQHTDTTGPGSQMISLEKGFADPPVSVRPKGYWDWMNGNFDLYLPFPELQTRKNLAVFEKKFIQDLRDKWDFLREGIAAPLPRLTELPPEVRDRFVSPQGGFLIRAFSSEKRAGL